MKYKISQFAKMQGVTYRTVWNWVKDGKVDIERDLTGHIWVLDTPKNDRKIKKVAIYTRVSSSEDKSNLDTQAERLVSYCNAKGYKVDKVVKEIGSGLNDTRPKLEKLLLDKSVDIIVVEHKDRLARFGTNYIQKLLEMSGRTLDIVNNVQGEEEDLMQDFTSIVTSFCSRFYGYRRSKRKTEELIKKLKEDDTN